MPLIIRTHVANNFLSSLHRTHLKPQAQDTQDTYRQREIEMIFCLRQVNESLVLEFPFLYIIIEKKNLKSWDFISFTKNIEIFTMIRVMLNPGNHFKNLKIFYFKSQMASNAFLSVQ